MTKSLRLLCAAACLVPSACATPGGGPFGMVMFDPKHHVSAAEPLFGMNDERCLDDPTFLLTLFAPDDQDSKRPEVCTRMKRSIAWGLLAHGQSVTDYSQRSRNEVIDAMMAASDRKCGRYIAFLQQYDGNINSTFGIAAQSAAIVASIASGGTAQAFAAGAGIASGVRGTLNESHFNNQTIGLLANAFENVRREQREAIAKLEARTVADYTLMRGIEDATRYHGSCTIVVGLKAAQRDVEAARSPNLDTMKKIVNSMKEIQGDLDKLGGKQRQAAPAAQGPDNVTPTVTEPAVEGPIDEDTPAPAPPIPGR